MGSSDQDYYQSSFVSGGVSVAHIVFVESNPIGFKGIEKAKELGHQVTFVTTDLSYYQARNQLQPVQGMIDRIIEVQTYDNIEQVQEEVIKAIGDARFDALMTFNELHVTVAAELAARFGLKNMHPAVARQARDKWKTREILSESGLPVPEYQYVFDLQEALIAARTIGYPVVVKPKDGTGSLYVRCIHNDAEMTEYFSELQSVHHYGRSIRREKGFLVEAFVKGPLVSAETVTYEGTTQVVGITERDVTGYPYFVEIGSLFPAVLPQVHAVETAARKVLEALDIQFGICHIEMVVNEKGPVVIEVNPRLAGGMIPKLIQLAAGMDMIQTAIELHLGNPPKVVHKNRQFAYSYHFTSPCTGRLVALKGWEQAVASPGVAEAAWWKDVGATLAEPRSNFDRLGYLVLQGEKGQEMRQQARDIVNQIQVIIEHQF